MVDEPPPPRPGPEPAPAGESTAPRLPGRWTLGRVLLLLLLLGHWVAVLAQAVPDAEADMPLGAAGELVGRESLPLGAWSEALLEPELPLPVLDTHAGHRHLSIQRISPLSHYLNLSNQGQRWKMFTPRRRMAACLHVHYDTGSGPPELVRVADPERLPRTRWVRWRLLEWMLMSDLGIHVYLPHCHRRIVEELAPGRYRRAGLRKHFAMLPVLRDEELGPGIARFEDSETLARQLADPRAMRLAHRPDTWIEPEPRP